MNGNGSEKTYPESLFTPREFTISHKMALGIGLRMGLRPWLVLLALTILWLAFLTWQTGVFPLFDKEWEIPLVVIAMAWVLLPASMVWGCWKKVRSYPQYGIPILHQVFPDGLASRSAVNEARSFWGLYQGWREYGTYFLLFDGAMHYIWPKGPYTDDEVEGIRRLFQENIRTAR